MSFSPNIRRIRLAVAGQSNTFGHGLFVHQNYYGAPYADPSSGTDGSWWPTALDKLFLKTDIWCDVADTAVGATGIVQHWCTEDSNSSAGVDDGVGTGVPYNMNDGVDWDKKGYLANSLAKAKEYSMHEPWVYISFGQSDSLTTTLANFQLGLQNAIDYYLANGVKVILGFTCYYAAQATWFANSGTVAVANILANYTGSKTVYAGANLYEELGTDILFFDGIHMTERSYILAGGLVGTYMINAFI